MTKRSLADGMRTAAAPQAVRADVPPSRRGRKTFPLYLDPELWKRCKLAALQRETSMQTWAIEALAEKLSRDEHG